MRYRWFFWKHDLAWLDARCRWWTVSDFALGFFQPRLCFWGLRGSGSAEAAAWLCTGVAQCWTHGFLGLELIALPQSLWVLPGLGHDSHVPRLRYPISDDISPISLDILISIEETNLCFPVTDSILSLFFGFPMGKSSLNIHIRHLLQLDTEPFYSWGMWSWAPLPWCFLASSPWPASSKRNWPHCRWSPRDRPWTAWANYAARGCTPPATGNTSTGWGHKSFGWYGEKWREDMVINLVMLACFLTDCWIYLIYLLLIVDDRISFFLGRSWGRIFQLRKLDESRLKVTDLWRIWLGILMLVLSRYAMVSTI